MVMQDDNEMTTPPALEIKGTAVSSLSLVFRSEHLADVEASLAQDFGERAAFFEGEPAILDLRHAPALTDVAGLVDLIRRYGFVPIALRAGAPDQEACARALNLAALCDSGDADRTLTSPTSDTAASPKAPNSDDAATNDVQQASLPFDTPAPKADAASGPAKLNAALIVDKPLRSGQQVYAKGGDLVVLAPVSFGAEIMADGDIHVYAALYGRALAGVSGDRSARIYALSMRAELISIAGVYRTFDIPLPTALQKKPVQVTLTDSDQIIVALIDP